MKKKPRRKHFGPLGTIPKSRKRYRLSVPLYRKTKCPLCWLWWKLGWVGAGFSNRAKPEARDWVLYDVYACRRHLDSELTAPGIRDAIERGMLKRED